MKKFSTPFTALAALTLATGCVFQNGEDPAMAKVQFQMQADSESAALAKSAGAAPELYMTDASGLQFKIQEARIYVEKAKLEADDKKTLAKDSLKGPYVVDLLNGAATPAMGILSVPAGTYAKVKMKLGEAKKDNGIVSDQDALFGHTLFVKGTYGDTGKPEKIFTLALTFDLELDIKSDTGLKLDSGILNTLLISLTVDQWLKNLNVKACLDKKDTIAPDRSISITENSELGKCLNLDLSLKINIPGSFKVKVKG